MGHVPSTEPNPGFLAPKQSPQALQSRDVENSVGRPAAKHEAPEMGKRADKSLRNGRVKHPLWKHGVVAHRSEPSPGERREELAAGP